MKRATGPKELKMKTIVLNEVEKSAVILLLQTKIAELKSRLLRERDGIAQTYIENDIAFYITLRNKIKDYE